MKRKALLLFSVTILGVAGCSSGDSTQSPQQTVQETRSNVDARDQRNALDRRIDNTPTVRSEILRGMHAADYCTTYEEDNFSTCVVKSIYANRQTHVETDPFELGIEFGAWFIGAPNSRF